MSTGKNPPGPQSGLFGMDYARKFATNPLATAFELKREYGDFVYLQMGPFHWYMISDPELVKEVLVTRSRQFGKTDVFKKVIRSVDGNGLVVSEGDFWLKQRHIIQPAFHAEMLADYATTICEIVEKHVSSWKEGMRIDLADEMTSLTLKSAAKIFLNLDVGDNARELADAVTNISQEMYQEFTEIIPLADWMPMQRKDKKRQSIETLNKFIYAGIERQKKEKSERRSVLSMLLDARDTDGKPMPQEQVRNEAITMFNAGHDSTAAALAWSWYLLMKNQDTYQKLRTQVYANLNSNSVASQHLPSMSYALLVAKEALRLYPPAWALPRQCSQDTELAKYHLPKGSLLNFFPYVMHRDSRFFPNPHTFKPERFNPDEERQMTPFSYFPFGAGPRSCIGREFALMEIQIILAILTRQFIFDLADPNADILPQPMISLEPKGGVAAIIRKRLAQP